MSTAVEHPLKRGKQRVWVPTAIGGASPTPRLSGAKPPSPHLLSLKMKAQLPLAIGKETFNKKIIHLCWRKRGTIIENAKEKSNSGGRVRDKKMSFWVSEAEQKKIKKLVAKTGLSQREYLLSAALGRTIYQVEELKPTLFELKAIGRNVNQLTMLAHQGRVTTVNLTEATNALERNYAAINGLYDALDGTVASGNIEPSDEVIDDGDV